VINLPDNLFKLLQAEAFKRDFYKFVLKAFEIMHNGQTPATNWHIEEMCIIAQSEVDRIIKGKKRDKHVICNVPPRSLKSFVWSVCLPAWAWSKAPHLKFVNVSYSADLSNEHNGKTRNLIESEWYSELFENVRIARGENKKSSFQTTEGGARWSTSMNGTITGKGADIIIFDDPMNPKKAHSDTERESTIRNFKETFQSRLNSPEIGSFFIIEQRLHEEDVTGYVLANQKDSYTHYSFPATNKGEIVPARYAEKYKSVKGREETYLFPKRFTPKFLNDQKINLGSYGYAGQYLQAPAPAEGGILKKAWFNIMDNESFYSITKNGVYDLFVDSAYTAKTENDATAVMVACKVKNMIYVCKVIEMRKELPELLLELKKIHDEHCTTRSKIYIEPKASGLDIINTLRRETSFNVVKDTTLTALKGANDKISRVHNVAPSIESERVILKQGHYIENFLNQCASFPNAKNDDMVDTLVMACKNYLRPSLKLK